MTFDLRKIRASKRSLRRTLATRDILEKLRMLDALRARTITLRAARQAEGSASAREDATADRLRRDAEFDYS